MVLLSGVAACGGTNAAPPETPLISIEEERRSAEPPPDAVPTFLEREDVNRTVDAGLGRFLQSVSIEASLVDGRFRGFRIVEVRPADAWRGVDLRVGDVVTAINGKPIERPEQAYEVFTSLKQADRLVVSYLRAGSARELVLPIVGGGAPPPAAAEVPARSGAVPGSLPEAPARQ